LTLARFSAIFRENGTFWQREMQRKMVLLGGSQPLFSQPPLFQKKNKCNLCKILAKFITKIN
jgi:hypothetical protein